MFTPLFLPMFLGIALLGLAAWAWWSYTVTTVVVVRHAEKEQIEGPQRSDDPVLTAEGQLRAYALAHTLSALDVTAVYSTPFKRTRQTAVPLAAARDLEVDSYGANDHDALVDRVMAEHAGGTVVIVGHSNTVPGIVEAFGGEEIPEISEAEHDNLYVIMIRSIGDDRIVHLRYGDPG